MKVSERPVVTRRRLAARDRAAIEAALRRVEAGPSGIPPALFPPTCGEATRRIVDWAGPDRLGIAPLLGRPLPVHVLAKLREAHKTLSRGPTFGHDDDPLAGDGSARLWLDTWVAPKLRAVLAWADGGKP